MILKDISKRFKDAIIIPIHKKGDPNTTSNFRGIGNMNCIAKIFMGIMESRLRSWEKFNNVLNEYQAGFRPQYSTMDNLYNLFGIVNIKWSEGKSMYGFFVDFKAAFDSIDRSALFYKLLNMGVSSKFGCFI